MARSVQDIFPVSAASIIPIPNKSPVISNAWRGLMFPCGIGLFGLLIVSIFRSE